VREEGVDGRESEKRGTIKRWGKKRD